MCGIAGGIGVSKPIIYNLYSMLDKVQYRGTDSYGVLTILPNGMIEDNTKGLGPVNITDINCYYNAKATTGIGHTRWATHGQVNISNCHPIKYGDYYTVLNGIIENYKDIRSRIIRANGTFNTDGDTEVISSLLHYHDRANHSNILKNTCNVLDGRYAFAAISPKYPNEILLASHGSPLYITSNGYFASDIQSLTGLDNKCYKLKCGEQIILTTETLKKIKFDLPIPSEIKSSGGMWQEIEDQCQLNIHNDELTNRPDLIVIFGCGSSYYAGLLGRIFFESILGIKCDVEYAADLQYHNLDLYPKNTLFIGISQSGETADTIKVLERLKNKQTLIITNNRYSQAALLSNKTVLLNCGAETAVAATKSFTASVLALLRLATSIEVEDLVELRQSIKQVLDGWDQYMYIADIISRYNHVLFLARHINFPIALESALKLKEVSYLHAEAIISSEIKHGPLALIDDKTLCIFIVGGENKGGQDKVFNNIQEVLARKGRVLVITNDKWYDSVKLATSTEVEIIIVPTVLSVLQPILFAVVGQLLAYYVGLIRGINVNHPRNLAKSVTVL